MSRRAALFIFFVALTAFCHAQTAQAIDWRIPLASTAVSAGAKAKAKYKDAGGEREFQVEIENLRRLRGATLSIFVNGALVGRTRINLLGNGRFERNTDLGQTVPVIRRGTPVAIRAPNGVLVFYGRF